MKPSVTVRLDTRRPLSQSQDHTFSSSFEHPNPQPALEELEGDFLVADKVVAGNDWPQIDFLLKSSEIIPHARSIAKLLSISRSIFLRVKTFRLVIEHEYISVRGASRRRRRSNVIGHKRRGRYELEAFIRSWFGFEIWLNPGER